MANQLNHVVLRIEETNKQTKIPLQGLSYAKSISKPFFKTDSVPKAREDALTKAWSNNHLLNQISEEIKALDASVPTKSASCLDKTCPISKTDSSSSDDEEEEANDSEEDGVIVLGEAFKENSPPAINKIHHWNPSIISIQAHHLLIFSMKNEGVSHQQPLMETLFILGISMANRNMKFLAHYKK